MASPDRRDRVAYLEDAEDDSGSSVEGKKDTRKYARSEAHPSPRKERPNTGKSRSEKRPVLRRGGSSSGSPGLTDSDSTTRSSKKNKEVRLQLRPDSDADQKKREQKRRERKRAEEEALAEQAARSEKELRGLRKTRPSPLKHATTHAVVQQGTSRRSIQDDPSYYGHPQPAVSGPRPRGKTRPASYYAGQPPRPPVANVGWHHSQQGPPPFPVGTFPPPQMFPGQSPHHGPPPPLSPAAMPGYFDGATAAPQRHHLKQRFENRPSSASGFRQQQTHEPSYHGYDEPIEREMSRRLSTSRKHMDDRRAMPPPSMIPDRRPQSAMPSTPPFRPPPIPIQRPSSRHDYGRPSSSHRRSVGFTDQPGYDDDDFLGDDGLFHDLSPPPSHGYHHGSSRQLARRESIPYDHSEYELMPATSRSRRSSMYGAGTLGSGGVSLDDDKYRNAMKYQDEISGGQQLPLTAESLRKASKRGGVPSSRSTRSSASRDESEHKRSNSTAITQSSSSHHDNVTVMASGRTTLRINGAEIECKDGSEITFRNMAGGGGSRGDSDYGGSRYELEDGRGRLERKALPHRSRAPSQSDSQSRGYAPSHTGYPGERYY